MYALVYIVDGEVKEAYGPFADVSAADLAATEIRAWSGIDAKYSRLIWIDKTWSYDGS